MIPSFYDSVEIARDRAVAKYQRRAGHWNSAFAFVVTLLEAILTLLLLRMVWRLLARGFRVAFGRPAVAG